MNRSKYTVILATILLAACASPEAEGEHLQEGGVGVETMAATWGAGGIPVPKKFTVLPGDSVERYTRTCELVEDGTVPSPGVCRAPLDSECNEDGGIPLPDTYMRPNFNEDRSEVVSITVTIKCRFPGGAS